MYSFPLNRTTVTYTHTQTATELKLTNSMFVLHNTGQLPMPVYSIDAHVCSIFRPLIHLLLMSFQLFSCAQTLSPTFHSGGCDSLSFGHSEHICLHHYINSNNCGLKPQPFHYSYYGRGTFIKRDGDGHTCWLPLPCFSPQRHHTHLTQLRHSFAF